MLNETERLIEALDMESVREENRRRETLAYRQSLELLRAIRLAPTLDTCRMILEGRRVPISQMDPKAVRAYDL